MAVAEQVIVSAGKIPAAAGFRRDEIGRFFKQAADQLHAAGPPAGADAAASMPEPRPAEGELDQLRAEFNLIPTVPELQQLQSRAQAFGFGCDSPGIVAECLDMAKEIAPHIGAAQEWLRGIAEQKNLALAADRTRAPPLAQANGSIARHVYLEELEAA